MNTFNRRIFLELIPAGISYLLSGFTVVPKSELGKILSVKYKGPNFGQLGIDKSVTNLRPLDWYIEVNYTNGIQIFKDDDSESIYLDSAKRWYNHITIQETEKQLKDHPEYLKFYGSKFNLYSTGLYQ